jgi:hypothetical protein
MLADPRDLFHPGFDRPTWRADPFFPIRNARVRLDHPLFGGRRPHVAAMNFGEQGYRNLCPTAGGDLGYLSAHPGVVGFRRNHWTLVADRGGTVDDRIASANACPVIAPLGSATQQSILVINQPLPYGLFDFEFEGWARVGQFGIQYCMNTASAKVQYLADNGAACRYQMSIPTGRPIIAAASLDNVSKVMLFNVEGVTTGTLTGSTVSIGGGVAAADGPAAFSTAEGGDQTYNNPSGHLVAFFGGNGFLNQGQLDALVADPWGELLEPDHGAIWYVPAAGEAPSGDESAEITGLPAAGQVGNGVIVVGYAAAGLDAFGGIGSVLGSVSATEAATTVAATGAVGSVTVPSAGQVGISGCVGGGEIGQILLRFDAAVALSPPMLTLELGAPWVRRSGWAPEAPPLKDWTPAGEPGGGWAGSEPTGVDWASAAAGNAGWVAVQTAEGGWTQ